MPNHTSNELFVSKTDDSKEASKQYRDFVKKSIIKNEEGKEIFTMNGAVPMPKELKGTYSGSYGDDKKQEALKKTQAKLTKKYGYKDWYDWSVDNWGTKWDAYDSEVTAHKIIGGYMEVEFQTAWSPPEKYLEQASKAYPKLEFDLGYVLEGYEGCGRIMYSKGELEFSN